jgi:hypothetical protein
MNVLIALSASCLSLEIDLSLTFLNASAAGDLGVLRTFMGLVEDLMQGEKREKHRCAGIVVIHPQAKACTGGGVDDEGYEPLH